MKLPEPNDDAKPRSKLNAAAVRMLRSAERRYRRRTRCLPLPPPRPERLDVLSVADRLSLILHHLRKVRH